MTEEPHAQVPRILQAAGYRSVGDADFGYLLCPPLTSAAHVVCEPDESWRAMPGSAVRTAITQHLNHYADALTAAGYGTATWGRGGQSEVLIVAADQEAADRQTPDIRAYLRAHNPEASNA